MYMNGDTCVKTNYVPPSDCNHCMIKSTGAATVITTG